MNLIDSFLMKIVQGWDSGILNPFTNLYLAFTDIYKANGVFLLRNLPIYILLYIISTYFYSRTIVQMFDRKKLKNILKNSSVKIDFIWSLISVFRINSLFITPIITLFSYAIFAPLLSAFNLFNLEPMQLVRAYLIEIDKNIMPIIIFILLILAKDFATYISHRVSHKSKILWCFHRVHHYPSQISPLAANRQHPFEAFIWQVFNMLIVTFALSIFIPFQGRPFSVIDDSAIDNLTLIFLFVTLPTLYAPFIHFPVPISFGKQLDKIFVSPAVHYIHHSASIKNVNFGSLFSFWDVFFGTYKGFDKASFDELKRLGTDEEGNNDDLYVGIISVFVQPFFEAKQIVFKIIKDHKMHHN